MAEKKRGRLDRFLYGEVEKIPTQPGQEELDEEDIEIPQATEGEASADPDANEMLRAVNDGQGGIYMVKSLMKAQPGLERQGLLGIMRITGVNPEDVLADADARIGAVNREVERVSGDYNASCEAARGQIGEMRDVIGQLKEKIAALEKDIARKQTVATGLRVQGAAMVGEIEVLKKILKGD